MAGIRHHKDLTGIDLHVNKLHAATHRPGGTDPLVTLYFNVMDYGAIGDGVADDTTAIQNAINAANGGTVFFPTGTYKISSALTVTVSGTVLSGSGKGNTIINQVTVSTSAIVASGVIIKISIHDMTLTGNGGSGNSGVSLTSVSHSDFRNLHITGFSYGIHFYSCGNLTFDSIYCGSNAYGFFSPYAGSGSAYWSWTIRFVNCYAETNVDGYRLNNTADLFFDTCIAVSNTGMGFNIGADNVGAELVDTVMLRNCQSDSNKDFGYSIYQYRFVQMNNIWASSGRDAAFYHAGIFIWLCNYINLSGILALNNGAEGVKLLGCKYVEGSNITATGNKTIGIYIESITQGNLHNINTSAIETDYWAQATGFKSHGANSNVTVSELISASNATNQVVDDGTGTIITMRGIAAPTVDVWAVGDTIWNDNPTAGGYQGWVCITAGTPGTWKGFGLIQA